MKKLSITIYKKYIFNKYTRSTRTLTFQKLSYRRTIPIPVPEMVPMLHRCTFLDVQLNNHALQSGSEKVPVKFVLLQMQQAINSTPNTTAMAKATDTITITFLFCSSFTSSCLTRQQKLKQNYLRCRRLNVIKQMETMIQIYGGSK